MRKGYLKPPRLLLQHINTDIDRIQLKQILPSLLASMIRTRPPDAKRLWQSSQLLDHPRRRQRRMNWWKPEEIHLLVAVGRPCQMHALLPDP
jgi:hypothetical protein